MSGESLPPEYYLREQPISSSDGVTCLQSPEVAEPWIDWTNIPTRIGPHTWSATLPLHNVEAALSAAGFTGMGHVGVAPSSRGNRR